MFLKSGILCKLLQYLPVHGFVVPFLVSPEKLHFTGFLFFWFCFVVPVFDMPSFIVENYRILHCYTFSIYAGRPNIAICTVCDL